MDEGYIKFNCDWVRGGPLPLEEIADLDRWRAKMFQAGLIGAYPNGIGFGNVSQRRDDSRFLVSGSATGGIEKLSREHYCVVESYDLLRNHLRCRGPIKASSESLTHASIYQEAPEVNGIVHVHNRLMWDRLMDKVPTTRRDVSYGTPQMAYEMKRLFDESDLREMGILVMAGHEEGIISFGKTLDEAGELMLKYFREVF